MADKISFTLDDLYITLRKHDKDILAHFNDDKLSDCDYLFYAIFSDIVSNALSIVANIFIDNESSVGVDNNARSIIEGFVILKMLKNGDISENQQKIFRNHFAVVEYENFKWLIKQQPDNPVIVEMKKRYDDAVKFLCEFYGCKKNYLKHCYYGDPLFYLKKNLDDDIRFVNLLKKYPIFNENSLRAYDFYSIMIHPRFADSEVFDSALLDLKKKYNRLVLNYLVEILKSNKLIVIDKKANTFADDFYKNPILVNNVANIQQIDVAFAMLAVDLCKLKEGEDVFTLFFLKTISSLVKDMMLSETLGYNEQVISKYKSFIELAAVHARINCADSQDEFKILKRAFAISSKLQLEEHFAAMNISKKTEYDELKDLYDSYYKNKYNIPTLEEFQKGMRNNSLYFLNPKESKNYNYYVKNVIYELFSDEDRRIELFEMYKLSKDMNHASGYNFNSCPGVPEFYSHLVMHAVYTWLINFVIHATAVVEKMDHKSKYTQTFLDGLKVFADLENNYMEEIGNKQREEYNNLTFAK